MYSCHAPLSLQVEEFVTGLQKEKNLYGWKEETLDSLLLLVLPAHNHKYVPYSPKPIHGSTKSGILITSLKNILQALVNNAGFRIQNVSCTNTYTFTDQTLKMVVFFLARKIHEGLIIFTLAILIYEVWQRMSILQHLDVVMQTLKGMNTCN